MAWNGLTMNTPAFPTYVGTWGRGGIPHRDCALQSLGGSWVKTYGGSHEKAKYLVNMGKRPTFRCVGAISNLSISCVIEMPLKTNIQPNLLHSSVVGGNILLQFLCLEWERKSFRRHNAPDFSRITDSSGHSRDWATVALNAMQLPDSLTHNTYKRFAVL